MRCEKHRFPSLTDFYHLYGIPGASQPPSDLLLLKLLTILARQGLDVRAEASEHWRGGLLVSILYLSRLRGVSSISFQAKSFS